MGQLVLLRCAFGKFVVHEVVAMMMDTTICATLPLVHLLLLSVVEAKRLMEHIESLSWSAPTRATIVAAMAVVEQFVVLLYDSFVEAEGQAPTCNQISLQLLWQVKFVMLFCNHICWNLRWSVLCKIHLHVSVGNLTIRKFNSLFIGSLHVVSKLGKLQRTISTCLPNKSHVHALICEEMGVSNRKIHGSHFGQNSITLNLSFLTWRTHH